MSEIHNILNLLKKNKGRLIKVAATSLAVLSLTGCGGNGSDDAARKEIVPPGNYKYIETEYVKYEPIKTETVKRTPIKTEYIKTDTVKTDTVKTVTVKNSPVR